VLFVQSLGKAIGGCSIAIDTVSGIVDRAAPHKEVGPCQLRAPPSGRARAGPVGGLQGSGTALETRSRKGSRAHRPRESLVLLGWVMYSLTRQAVTTMRKPWIIVALLIIPAAPAFIGRWYANTPIDRVQFFNFDISDETFYSYCPSTPCPSISSGFSIESYDSDRLSPINVAVGFTSTGNIPIRFDSSDTLDFYIHQGSFRGTPGPWGQVVEINGQHYNPALRLGNVYVPLTGFANVEAQARLADQARDRRYAASLRSKNLIDNLSTYIAWIYALVLVLFIMYALSVAIPSSSPRGIYSASHADDPSAYKPFAWPESSKSSSRHLASGLFTETGGRDILGNKLYKRNVLNDPNIYTINGDSVKRK
jgi:hypothetical protein